MREDGSRFARTMFVLEAGEIFLARRIVSQKEHRRFREGPLEVRMADLRAGGSRAFARGFLRTFDESAIGHEILDPREAGNVMNLVEQHQTQNLADARDRLPP